jgi:hypothetical protein
MGKETIPQQPDDESSHRGSRRAQPAAESTFPPLPWERLLAESPKAFHAFGTFRDLGAKRSYAETARALGKHESQVRRWASQFDWRARAHAWDLAQSREVELLVRQQREQAARRRMQHQEFFEGVAIGGLRRLVWQDPATGETVFSQKLTPGVLLGLYQQSLQIDRALPASDAAGAPVETGDPLQSLSDLELQHLIALAKERAYPKGESEDDSSPP